MSDPARLTDEQQEAMDALLAAVRDEEVQIGAMSVTAFDADHAALVAIWKDGADEFVVKPLALLATDDLLTHVVPPQGRLS